MSIYKMRSLFGAWTKYVFGLIILIFVVGAFFVFGGPNNNPQNQRDDRVTEAIAIVNEREITRGEFEAMWEQVMEAQRKQGVRSPLRYADIRGSIFQSLVQSRQTLDAADELGVDVSDDKVEGEINKVITMFLNQNREAVLGKLSKKQMKVDPRDDDEYKKELAMAGSSIAQQEEIVRSKIPVEQVRAQIAQQGIMEELKKRAKRVSDNDVMESYNVYRVRQIVLMNGSLPKAQLTNKANKILAEAKAGKDFAALAKLNSEGPMKTNGGEAEYSFDMRWMFPPEVQKVIKSMKPGKVSPVIHTQSGLYIVKLESITPKLPANLDKKAKAERKKMIQQDNEMTVMMAFQQDLITKQKVKVTDPEMLAYWTLGQAMQSMNDPAAYEKKRSAAMKSLKRAVEIRPNNFYAECKLAQLEMEAGMTDAATKRLTQMLDIDTVVDSPDLRIMLGDLYVKQNKNDEALEQYKIASESASYDPSIHQQLVMKYQQMKKPELVAAEQKWVADYEKKMAEYKAAQEKKMPKTAPAAPKSGE